MLLQYVCILNRYCYVIVYVDILFMFPTILKKKKKKNMNIKFFGLKFVPNRTILNKFSYFYNFQNSDFFFIFLVVLFYKIDILYAKGYFRKVSAS